MDHLVGERIDLNLWGHCLLLEISLVRLLLLLATIGILQNCIEVALEKSRPLTDLWVELKILLLLSKVVLSADLLLDDRVLIDTD